MSHIEGKVGSTGFNWVQLATPIFVSVIIWVWECLGSLPGPAPDSLGQSDRLSASSSSPTSEKQGQISYEIR
jgi:hypothetical protein